MVESLRERLDAMVEAVAMKGKGRNVSSPPAGTAPLRRCVDPRRPITYGIVQAGPHVRDGVPYIRPVDMPESGAIDAAALRRTDPTIAEAYGRSRVLGGDIVVSIGPSYGKTLILPPELSGANLTQGTARVACRSGVNTRFIQWVLRAPTTRSYWDACASGATFRALNLEPLGRTPIPIFDPADQAKVALALDMEDERHRGLCRRLHEQIRLLQERRQALITDAVTGQVPVPA